MEPPVLHGPPCRQQPAAVFGSQTPLPLRSVAGAPQES